MKLLTHNMLTSKCLKGVTVGYPLGIVAKDIKLCVVDFNSEFVARIIPKLDWATLWKAADSIGHVGELPQTLIQDFETNEEFLKKVHHVLLEVEVINGDLLCPESGRKFPINDGIPNMLLNEDEGLAIQTHQPKLARPFDFYGKQPVSGAALELPTALCTKFYMDPITNVYQCNVLSVHENVI